MKRTIYLVDPAGGGMTQQPGLIVVKHKILKAVAEVNTRDRIANPGELRVTQAALDLLGKMEVRGAFINHLNANWFTTDDESIAELEEQLHRGWVIYNSDPDRGFMIITYPGDNSTLITSQEY